MTREEAIGYIKIAKKMDICQYDGTLEAFDMAISALEQEPCDDAISRAVRVVGSVKMQD